MPEVRELTVNVCYDSAASTYLYEHRIFETTAQLAGAERILFASDFPVLKQGPLLDRVRERNWASSDAIANVLGENAIRIYGLEGMFA